MSAIGTSTVIASFFGSRASTTVTGAAARRASRRRTRRAGPRRIGAAPGLAAGASPRRARVPPRKRAISSRLRCVADRPMRCSGRSTIRSSRSSDSAMCAPRLVETSAWISSTITVSTARSRSRAFEVSSRNSDSGVVIRMSAGSRWNRVRSAAGVSPVRIDIAGTWWGTPAAAARWAMPASGARRLRSTSTASAFSGDRYRTRQRASRRRHRREHQPIEAGQERGERLAGAGRREDERRLARGDRRPALSLGAGRAVEGRGEPVGHGRVEQTQDVRRHRQFDPRCDHSGRRRSTWCGTRASGPPLRRAGWPRREARRSIARPRCTRRVDVTRRSRVGSV